MRILQIGLGSMGKRRVRNLQAIGGIQIVGFDFRQDRRNEAAERYCIQVSEALPPLGGFDAVIISTPPDRHQEYIQKSLDAGRPCFVEASVVLHGLPELLSHPNLATSVVAPSCTMRFHPAVRQIKAIVSSNEFGRVTNYTYHCGQYLPDWHPWEKISEFYVGQKQTGGAREIVPFELTWLVDVLGFPSHVSGCYLRTGLLDVDIDDVYAVALRYPQSGGTLMVDVTSRYATRSLIVNLEQAQVRWNWEDRRVWVYDASRRRNIVYHDPEGKAVAGYNENIVEEMYIEEMRCFLGAVGRKAPFPNTLSDDVKVLQLLHQIESSSPV